MTPPDPPADPPPRPHRPPVPATSRMRGRSRRTPARAQRERTRPTRRGRRRQLSWASSALGGRFDAFAEGREDVVQAGEVLDRRAQPDAQGEALDDLARAPRDHVQSEHAPALAVEDDLEEPVACADVREAPDVLVADDVDLEALLTGLLLGQADCAELRVGEDGDRQNRVVGGGAIDAEHVGHRDPRLVLRDGRELRDRVDVACGPDARYRAAQPLVDRDPGLRRLHADLLELEAFEVRNAAGGEQDLPYAELPPGGSVSRL